MRPTIKNTGYEFWLCDEQGGHIVSLDADKMKFRLTDKPRVRGNWFGCSTENVSFTITVWDRYIVGTFR